MRLAGIAASTTVSVATSTDGGSSWSPYAGAPSVSENVYGGKIAMSASGDTLLWAQATGFSSVMVSKNGAAFTAVGSLLTIVLVILTDILFKNGLETLSLWDITGSGMIVLAFAALVYDSFRYGS